MRPTGAKYSPGPWSVSKKSKLTGAVVAEDGEVVCDPTGAGRHEDEAEANARLISAAPELLECLKDAVCNFDCDAFRGTCPNFDSESWRCSYDRYCTEQKWLAAIRKAEGLDGSDAGSSGA